MATYGGPDIVTDGLILYLDAANTKSYPGSGTSWSDLSGNGNNGTLINGPTFSSENNGSLVFDGVDDRCTIVNSSGDISLGLNNFTLSVWYKNLNTNDYHHLYNVLNQEMFAWKANITQIGEIYFYGGSSYRSFLGNFGEWNLDYNIWNMHCLVRDGLTFKGYKNGIYIGEHSESFIKNISGGTIILGSRANGSETANHQRNLQMVYNRALTSEEILQNYNATKGRFGL